MNQCAPGAGDSAEFTPASLALRAAGVTAASAFGLAALSFSLAWKALR